MDIYPTLIKLQNEKLFEFIRNFLEIRPYKPEDCNKLIEYIEWNIEAKNLDYSWCHSTIISFWQTLRILAEHCNIVEMCMLRSIDGKDIMIFFHITGTKYAYVEAATYGWTTSVIGDLEKFMKPFFQTENIRYIRYPETDFSVYISMDPKLKK